MVSDPTQTVVIYSFGYNVLHDPLYGVRYDQTEHKFMVYADILQAKLQLDYKTEDISQAAEYLFELQRAKLEVQV